MSTLRGLPDCKTPGWKPRRRGRKTVTSTSAPAITDAEMVTVVVMRALTGLTSEGGGGTLRCPHVPARRVSPCSRLVRMQWVAVSAGRLCGLARGRAGRDHHAYWLPCPVSTVSLGEKLVAHMPPAPPIVGYRVFGRFAVAAVTR